MHVPAAGTVMGVVISSLGTWGLGGNRGGALHQELPQGSPCPAWPRGAFWGSFHSSPPHTHPIATPFQGWARRCPPPSPAGRHADEVGHLVHVVGGQQHHLLVLREVVVEDAVQQALPLELAGWARHPRVTGLSASPLPFPGGHAWSWCCPQHPGQYRMESSPSRAHLSGGQWGMFLGTRAWHRGVVLLIRDAGQPWGHGTGTSTGCRAGGRWGWQGVGRGTHRGGDALQLAQGHFVVHGADIPPHVVVLGHRDLHGVGTAVTSPLSPPCCPPGVAQGWAQHRGKRGCWPTSPVGLGHEDPKELQY